MNDQLRRIAAKLDSLRAEGWERRKHHFGVETHRFIMQPPVSDTILAEFERAHGAELPQDYRAFLRTLGDGGAGPYYGILPLEQCCELAEGEEDHHLAECSPLVPHIRYEADWSKGIYNHVFCGILTLADQGCCNYCGLIVSGEARGQVVYLGLDRRPPFFVHETSFLDWYERWLDEIIEDADTSWFGYCRGGSEEELLAVIQGPSSLEDQVDAARALFKKTRLSAKAIPLLRKAGDSASSELRIASLFALVKTGENAGPLLVTFLGDPAPEVRKAAALALLRYGDKAHAAEIDRAMRDEANADAFFSQGCVLRQWNCLEIQTLEQRASDANPVVRRHVAYLFEDIKVAEPLCFV